MQTFLGIRAQITRFACGGEGIRCPSGRRARVGGSGSRGDVWRSLQLLVVMLFGPIFFGTAALQGQSTYQITSATVQNSGAAYINEGQAGASILLGGTLPTPQSQPAAQGCFYTGSGSTAPFPLSALNADGSESLTVPAATIQAIPQGNFTAANNYTVTGLVYFVAGSAICDGTFDSTLTNQYPVPIVAPSLGSYAGPVSVPQTNPAATYQSTPIGLVLPAAGFLPRASTIGATTVTFGSFGAVPIASPDAAISSVYIAVPASFASSEVGTNVSLSICNTLTGVATPVCTTPTPAITLTVTALTASAGTITAAPNPVLTSGQTVLTAQFAKAADATGNAGAPSGPVSFVADGTSLAAAPLVLDKTATFAAQTTTVTAMKAATPVITPATGAYTGAQTVTITDATPGAAIYYTQDGSAPATGSTLYTAPFSISASQTVNAIAAVSGYLNSAVATATYRVTVRPPTQLAFLIQPVDTALNTAITPPVQVAVEDATGAVVTGSTAAVKLVLRSNPGQATLGGATTVNAVNGVATFSDLTLSALTPAGALDTLYASSGELAGALSSGFKIVPPAITLAVQSELVGIGSTLNGTITLGAPAPAGGLLVTLTSGTPADVTISPATVTVAAGGTTGTFTYTGVAVGNSTLTATAPSYQTGTVATTGTAAQVSLGTIPNVAPAQMQSIALSLATPAPAGGTTVTFTIANTNIATVTSTVFVPAGQQTAATNPQVTGLRIGTTTVTATAPGYAPATLPVVVTVTAAFTPGTTNINLATATNTSLTISAPAPPGGIVFTLSSDAPAIATVPATLTVLAGATSVPIAITGVSAGSTTIRADSAGITEATGTVNVDSAIGTSTLLTGYDLEVGTNLYLPVAPSAPTTVTVTSSDPTVAVVSKSGSVAGQATLTFPNTTSYYIGSIAVQGLKVGTATLNITAAGYTAGSIVVTVNPSGFVIDGNQLSFSTTTYSSPTTLTVYSAILNPDLSYYDIETLNPQSATLNLSVTSSSTATGTVTSPLVYQPDVSRAYITFQPVATGTTNIKLGAPPAGFSLPTTNQQSVATVLTPAITVSDYLTGAKLQGNMDIYLPEAPPAAVTVTVTSSDPTIATLSNSDTTAGTGTVTYNVAAGQTHIGRVWFQGQAVGSSILTLAAPGYTNGTSTITVDPAGFYYYDANNFSTTTFSSTTNLQIVAATLRPGTLTLTNYGYELNPGLAPLTVPITDSTPGVGTVTGGGVVFNAGSTYPLTTFQPVAAGTTTLTLGTPSGFSTPSPVQAVTATVTAPAISVNSLIIGAKQEGGLDIYLPVAPPTGHPVDVTVTLNTAGVATLSNSSTVAGTASTFTFPGVTSSYAGRIYVQGQTVGSTTITESAPGYTTGTNTITVDPSGFVFYYSGNFTTTTFSGTTNISVVTAILNPGSLTYQNYGYPISPGVGPITVPITDSAPSVGTVSASSYTFNAGDTSKTITFQPVSAGTATIAFGTPSGFSTYSQGQSLVATVTAPVISIGNITTGVNLDGGLNISLPQNPPNPVTVTVTSSGPGIATLSKDPTVVGTSSVTFTNVTTSGVGTIYVQGQSLGTALLTEVAAGYTNGSSTVTVIPSGFVFYYGGPPFTSGIANGNYGVDVYAAALNPGTLTLQQINLALNPGIGSVSVPLTSSDTSVGTFVTNPIVFTSGVQQVTAEFDPLATGTTTISIGTPTTPAGFSTPSQYESGTVTVQP